MLNKVTLIGNLGKDPDSKTLPNGEMLCSFSIATSEKYTDKQGNKVETTEWHNVVVWRKLAEIAAKYLKKGSKVYIEGKLKTRSWEKDGEKKYATDIVAESFIMLDGAKTENAPVSHEPTNYHNAKVDEGLAKMGVSDKTPLEVNETDDLPF